MIGPVTVLLLLLLLHLTSLSAFQPIISLRQYSNHNFNNKHHGSAITTTTLLQAAVSNLNKDGKCKFGTKEYWDTMYNGDDDPSSTLNDSKNDDGLSAEEYSWYCCYRELQPFWNMLVERHCDDKEKDQVKVLIAGIGNDSTPVQMYDDGWTNMIAFDYSEGGVCRARTLFGPTRLDDGGDCVNDDDDTTTTGSAKLLVADCRNIPIPNGSIDATLDKGTLDAIYITGKEVFLDSVKELTRVTATDGVIICVSAVIPSEELLNAFQSVVGSELSCCCWETVLDGGLAFADGGEATIDLGANLYCFRRK